MTIEEHSAGPFQKIPDHFGCHYLKQGKWRKHSPNFTVSIIWGKCIHCLCVASSCLEAENVAFLLCLVVNKSTTVEPYFLVSAFSYKSRKYTSSTRCKSCVGTLLSILWMWNIDRNYGFWYKIPALMEVFSCIFLYFLSLLISF